jgi:hypothetical protein
MPTLEEIPYQNDKNTKWTILPFDEEYKFNFEYYDYLSNIKQDLLKNIPELYFVPETHMNDLTYEYVEKNKFNKDSVNKYKTILRIKCSNYYIVTQKEYFEKNLIKTVKSDYSNNYEYIYKQNELYIQDVFSLILFKEKEIYNSFIKKNEDYFSIAEEA